jgi:acyl-CoA synthetase (NDP forming)
VRDKRLDAMFNPRSIAIIGASTNVAKWGFNFMLHLMHGGYKGRYYPVNPGGGEILGHKAYKSILDIPDEVDLAFILIPPEPAIAALRQCGQKGVPACVVVTAGFGELGGEGERLQADLIMAANEAGIAMVGPNCAGISSPRPMGVYCTLRAAILGARYREFARSMTSESAVLSARAMSLSSRPRIIWNILATTSRPGLWSATLRVCPTVKASLMRQSA